MTLKPTNGNGCATQKAEKIQAFDANGNMPLSESERLMMIEQLERKFAEIMDILRIDRTGDPNSRETPRRLARMWVNELFIGRYTPPPPVTIFPNRKKSTN